MTVNNLDYKIIIKFLLSVTYYRPRNGRRPVESEYVMLLTKKRKIRNFSDTRGLLPDVKLRKMKILRDNYMTLGKMS